MTVILSQLAGAGWQFFDNSGNPLSGGLLYTYEAGTTTPLATYTTISGNVAHTNPIVLDSAGRVPSGEIWVDASKSYKFVLRTSAGVLIGTYDNLNGYALGTLVDTTMFNVVGDGVADDTIAMLNAMDYCRANSKTLLLNGRIKFVASTVPAGRKHLESNGYYVYACSMIAINPVELLVDGKIGFDFTGIDQTVVQGFQVTTTNRQMTESDQNNTSPTLFGTLSGSKTSGVYRDLVIYNTVTNLTGAYRAGATVREYGCSSLLVDNIVASNTILTVAANSSSNVSVTNIFGYNIETNVYLSSCSDISATNLHHINTQTQADYWVGRTASPVRAINGMDNLLVEFGTGKVVVSNLVGEYCHERMVYCQVSSVTISNCLGKNTDGYKVVGESYSVFSNDIFVDDCHIVFDSTFTPTRSRNNYHLFVTYWANNVIFQNSSITNPDETSTIIQSVANVGRNDGSTQIGVYFYNVRSVNACRFLYTFLSTLSSAQLAALSPPGSFISVKNITVEKCFIKKALFPTPGTMLEYRAVEASADALLNYAGQNITFRNNTIELESSGSTDVWLFDMKYMDGCVSENTAVNKAFSFYSSAITAPYRNVLLKETNLLLPSATAPTEYALKLAFITLLPISVLQFQANVIDNPGDEQTDILRSEQFFYGNALDKAIVTVSVTGFGYRQLNTDKDWAIQLIANGAYYWGKLIAGVITDQIAAPPITLNSTATLIDIRGDLAPTVRYQWTLTKL